MCGIYSILDLADAARCVVYNIHEHADAAMCVIYNIIERAGAAVCVIYSIIAKHAGTAEIWILEGASFRCHSSSSFFWAQARGARCQAKCAPIWGSICEKKSSEHYAPVVL